MKIRYLIYFIIISLAIASCQKSNDVSKIPQISLMYFGPDSIIVNVDTAFLQFSITDGDADLGNDPTGAQKDIYIKDFRTGYDTGFAGYFFPAIDKSIEDPKKGIQGICLFMFTSYILSPRTDSVHLKYGDTTHFEFYIMDRAGHQSNHITTKNIIMRP